jgi:tRNA threonylcarbamoyladenosine biosynthesis protein TsaE
MLETVDFTYHLNDIDTVAVCVLEQLTAKTVLFDGAMGAGKTTFIKALLKAMKSDDVGTSPTFSIVNEYVIPNDKIYHLDCYRIESLNEAYDLGIEEYINGNNWLFIEWYKRIEYLVPQDTQTITITDLSDNKRALKVTVQTDNLTKKSSMSESKF